MSMDILQDRIRKLKSPLIADLSFKKEHIPAHLLAERELVDAYYQYCLELMEGLQKQCAGVRFSFDRFALMNGLRQLSDLLIRANKLGYYVLLDGPNVLSSWGAATTAEVLFGEDSPYPCHGLILSPWIGSDAIKPFLPYCKDHGKSIFLAVRTANKTAAELQDLMTGGRLTHVAAADIVNRHGMPIFGKCGFSHIGALTAGTNGAAVNGLRTKYKQMFLLVDGIDYPGGNAKICSYAFDRLGHGAAVCAGHDLTAAWIQAESDGRDCIDLAVKAAERLTGNISRYISIL